VEVTNDRPWRLADLSFAPSGNGRERATTAPPYSQASN
jgi:hypothetical protein